MRHRFYCASAPTLLYQLDRATQLHSDLFPPDELKRFIREQIPNVLTSAGEAIMSNAMETNHLGMRQFAKIFPRERNAFLLDQCSWAVDNGGFQIARCLVPKEHLDGYRQDFHDFVRGQFARFDFTFTLDMVPAVPRLGETVPCLFETAREMYEFNHRSYQEAASLPDEARKKMRCVFHFRGPRVFRAWKRILFNGSLAERFTHYATGGLVKSQGIKKLPVIGFAIPLVPLIALSKRLGRASFDFHVLGQSQPAPIIAMRLIEEHVLAAHGVHVHFTHDAISPLTEAWDRSLTLVDTQTLTLRPADLDSDNALFYFTDGKSAVDALYDLVNHDLGAYGIGPFDPKRYPYQTRVNGDLTPLGYVLGIINQTYNRTKVWRWAGGIAKACYPYYQAGDKNAFKSKFAEITGDVICPQRHENQVALDAKKMVASLDFLTQLDSDYADSLVCSRLIGEEHPDLKGSI